MMMATFLEKFVAKRESDLSERIDENTLSEEQKSQVMESLEEWLAIWAN